MREYSREHAARINEQRRARRHRSHYGLSDSEKLELFESSDGLCALCLEQPATVIDHDSSCCSHKQGRMCGKCVRGALCHFCNKGLGYIEKMGATSEAIVEYLTTDWRSESAA